MQVYVDKSIIHPSEMEMYMITCRLMYEGTYFASNIYFSYKIGAFNIGIKQVVIPTALL